MENAIAQASTEKTVIQLRLKKGRRKNLKFFT